MRSDFRRKYGIEHWDELEATKNQDQYNTLIARLNEKARRKEILGKSPSGAFLGSLFEPLGALLFIVFFWFLRSLRGPKP